MQALDFKKVLRSVNYCRRAPHFYEIPGQGTTF